MSSYYERHAFYRKHIWCFSTFRTKNIHIYLVCCSQSTLATIDIPFRASITSGTRFVENISGVFPHLERRIYKYILCVTARAHSLRSIFPFEQVLRTYRKHFWCFSTFRTKNMHIYLVCCCQRTIAMIDISFRAIFPFEQELRAARVSSVAGSTYLLRSIFYKRHARFIENISGVFPHLERGIHTYILSVSHTFCSLQARITNRTRVYSKVVYC